MRLLPVAALLALLLAACAGDAGLDLRDGYHAEVLVDGLERPTQFALGPHARLWVAELGDGDGEGRVLAVPTGDVGEPQVLLDGLERPTGLAVAGRALWLQLERDIVRVPIAEDGALGAPERVLSRLPYDGRSQGTLSVTLDRTLLFTTTGDLAGGEVVAGSGRLWELDPAHPDAPTPFARGFRNAYAHTVDGDGRVWATEINRDAGHPEELNAVARGGDHGWPGCVGDREPVEAHGGSEAACADTEAPVATFPADAEPTSVGVSPWRVGELVVVLANTRQVVTVQPDEGALAEPESLAGGFARPRHLLVLGSNILVGDEERGVIYRIGRG